MLFTTLEKKARVSRWQEHKFWSTSATEADFKNVTHLDKKDNFKCQFINLCVYLTTCL